MYFSLSLGIVSLAFVAPAALAIFVPNEAPLGQQWSSLPVPSKVSYAPTSSNKDDCKLSVTVVTTKCAGGPYRWGSIFQAYDDFSKKSWTVSSSVKGYDHDLYSKMNFVAECGTNGRIFPTDSIQDMTKFNFQGVRFFASKDYSAAWVEKSPTDDETGEPRTTPAPLRLYYFSDSPTRLRNIVSDKAKFGYDDSRIVTTQKDANLYLEFCK